MKIERLTTNVITARSPDRAQCDILGMVFDVIWPIQITIVGVEPLCDL